MGRCGVQMEIGPCPAAAEVCPYKGCPENQGKLCDGQGWCYNGACRCAVDRAGAACSQSLCDTDADCPREQTCSETHECVGEDDLPAARSSPLDFDAVRPLPLMRCVCCACCACSACNACCVCAYRIGLVDV